MKKYTDSKMNHRPSVFTVQVQEYADLVYLHGKVVLQHLSFLLQEVYYVLSQAFFGSILLSPAALLRLQSQHGQVINRSRGLKFT